MLHPAIQGGLKGQIRILVKQRFNCQRMQQAIAIFPIGGNNQHRRFSVDVFSIDISENGWSGSGVRQQKIPSAPTLYLSILSPQLFLNSSWCNQLRPSSTLIPPLVMMVAAEPRLLRLRPSPVPCNKPAPGQRFNSLWELTVRRQGRNFRW